MADFYFCLFDSFSGSPIPQLRAIQVEIPNFGKIQRFKTTHATITPIIKARLQSIFYTPCSSSKVLELTQIID
jgi:hypothetical protein